MHLWLASHPILPNGSRSTLFRNIHVTLTIQKKKCYIAHAILCSLWKTGPWFEEINNSYDLQTEKQSINNYYYYYSLDKNKQKKFYTTYWWLHAIIFKQRKNKWLTQFNLLEYYYLKWTFEGHVDIRVENTTNQKFKNTKHLLGKTEAVSRVLSCIKINTSLICFRAGDRDSWEIF